MTTTHLVYTIECPEPLVMRIYAARRYLTQHINAISQHEQDVSILPRDTLYYFFDQDAPMLWREEDPGIVGVDKLNARSSHTITHKSISSVVRASASIPTIWNGRPFLDANPRIPDRHHKRLLSIRSQPHTGRLGVRKHWKLGAIEITEQPLGLAPMSCLLTQDKSRTKQEISSRNCRQRLPTRADSQHHRWSAVRPRSLPPRKNASPWKPTNPPCRSPETTALRAFNESVSARLWSEP